MSGRTVEFKTKKQEMKGAVYVPTTVNYAVPKNTGAYFKKHTCSLRYGKVTNFPKALFIN